MDSDPLEEALRDAAAPIIRDILKDRERLPHQLSALMLYIAEHLCQPGFNATKAKRATKVRNHTLATLFRDHMDMTLRVYIEVARLRIAERLLHHSGLRIGQISLAVGYSCHDTFLRAYKAWAGESPAQVRGKPWTPEVDYPTWRKLWYRELDKEAAREIIEKLQGMYPDADEEEPERKVKEELSALRIPIDAEAYMRFQAEEVWRQIRDLSPENQQQFVRECDFRSRALFDLLRKKSRLKGRRDRQQGIFLAKLALDSLEGLEEFFGEQIHDLRALGHAWLANAYRLAFDFSAADAEFDRADAEWRAPRQVKETRVHARVLDLKISLKILQRSYDEALQLTERTKAMFHILDDPCGQVRSLVQCATIHSYCGAIDESIAALQKASDLLDKENEPHLAYVVSCNLATELARARLYSSATESLSHARACCKQLKHPLGVLRIHWVDATINQAVGNLALAEELFLTARTGYAEAEELPSLGIVSLDLAILYSEQGRWARVLKAASEAIPPLLSSSLHKESLIAVNLLTRTVETGEVTSTLLRQVRDKVMHDPLIKPSL